MKKARGPKKYVHLVIGSPDEENCPICRAHPQPQAPSSSGDGAFAQELSLAEILRCPCPMCAEARKEAS